ncbi:hypothetical protein D3C81_1935660 [compost metagenome]
MQLNAIETGGLRVLRCTAKRLNHCSDFLDRQRPWHAVRTLWSQQANMPAGSDGARRHWLVAFEKAGVGDAPHMPQLQKHLASRRMYGIGDHSPAVHLLL